jgi:hypothetical protein
MTVPVTRMTQLLTGRKIKGIKETLNSKLPAEKCPKNGRTSQVQMSFITDKYRSAPSDGDGGFEMIVD